jgi:hypothetical protein
MQAKYVTAVKCLTITGDLGRGDRISDDLFITNNQGIIKSLIPKEHILIIGTMEWQYIQNSDTVVWGTVNFNAGDDPLRLLNGKLYETQGFLNTIWLFFDNSIDTEIGFLFYIENGAPTASSSYIDVARYTADGTSITTVMDREQLRQIRKFHRDNLNDETFGPYPVTKVVKSEGRITRALYLVQAASGSKDVGVKIMHYCSALETIFSTSQAELAHQLSERLAYFIGTTGRERVETYRAMKKAYALRSKITHGAAISPRDFNDLVSLSVACDNFLRRSFKRMFHSPETHQLFGSEKQLDDYFIETILGATDA